MRSLDSSRRNYEVLMMRQLSERRAVLARLLWLAFDLMLRPVTPEELEWHRTAKSEFSTGGRQAPKT